MGKSLVEMVGSRFKVSWREDSIFLVAVVEKILSSRHETYLLQFICYRFAPFAAAHHVDMAQYSKGAVG